MAGRISGKVVGLIIAGLRRYAPHALPGKADLAKLIPSAEDDGVPLEPYRRVLEHVLETAGGAKLLEAGRAIHHLRDPMLFVLLNSDTPELLLEKERRLSRFIHSRHGVEVRERSDTSLLLEHTSEQEAPHDGEDLAACGQHLALFEELGCRGVRCRFPASADPALWVYRSGEFRDPAPGGRYHLWHIEWDEFAPTRRPMEGLDDLLLATGDQRELDEQPELLTRLEQIVRGDLGRTWTLARVAAAVDMSPRSLQRALAAHGTSYRELVDRIRTAEAARLLERSELSVTQIGYVCGFADTAHFSRRFQKRFGAPPGTHRRRAAAQ